MQSWLEKKRHCHAGKRFALRENEGFEARGDARKTQYNSLIVAIGMTYEPGGMRWQMPRPPVPVFSQGTR